MARYIDADLLLTDEKTHTLPNGCGKASGNVVVFVDDIEKLPTADVAPKEKIIQEVVSDIKKLIHSHARYPRSVEIDNYITLKVVDAILNDYLKKYSKQERT